MTSCRRLAVGVLFAAALLAPSAATAAGSPSVVVDRSSVKVGDRVHVTLAGWPTQRAVVISVCGNEARRGSVDCDLAGSLGYGISGFDNVHVTEFKIGAPPVPCPCVIQATNTTQSESAYAPVTITGIPSEPVVGNSFAQPLTLDVDVHRASQNPLAWLRSFVGGPTPYAVEVRVRNRSAIEASGVRLTARAGRSATDQARRVALPAPETLAPGASWGHTQRVTLSAPVIGHFVWTVTASGDAALARSETRTSHQPWGVYLLLFALVGDFLLIADRRLRRPVRASRRTPCAPTTNLARRSPPVWANRSSWSTAD